MTHRRHPARLFELTYEEASAVLERGAVALLPAGATEAHGPHLPLGTDVVISEAAALRAAELLIAEGHEALVLPPLAYGVTDFAQGFAGTVSIPFDAVRALVHGVVRGAMDTGFVAVVALSAHLEPDNLRAIREGVAQAVSEGAKAVFVDVTRRPHPAKLGAEFQSGACHAGRYETSLVMAATPFLVHEDLAVGLPENPTSLSEAIAAGRHSFREAGGDRAYFGAPAEASAAEGEALLSQLATIYLEAARALLAE